MYRLTDFLMFSPRTYNRLFERYNHDLWPLHLVALAIGIVILWQRKRPRVVAALLAVAWLWVAWAFFWERFSTIHTYGKWFAVAFVLEAVLLWSAAASLPLSTPAASPPARRRCRGCGKAAAMPPHSKVIFALILLIYPLIPPRREVFGIAPDPTALATIALLPRWPAMIIPILWCVFSAATHLAMAAR